MKLQMLEEETAAALNIREEETTSELKPNEEDSTLKGVTNRTKVIDR